MITEFDFTQDYIITDIPKNNERLLNKLFILTEREFEDDTFRIRVLDNIKINQDNFIYLRNCPLEKLFFWGGMDFLRKSSFENYKRISVRDFLILKKVSTIEYLKKFNYYGKN